MKKIKCHNCGKKIKYKGKIKDSIDLGDVFILKKCRKCGKEYRITICEAKK